MRGAQRRVVVIVGGGPAGLILAHVLGSRGVDAVVLERRARAHIGGPPKAGSIDFRTVELLDRVGLVPSVVRFDAPNGVCEFRTPDERVVFDYGARTGGRPHFIYPQHLLVEALAVALEASGGDLRCDTVVHEVRSVAGSLAVHTSDGPVLADLVVGCDGARSTVAGAMDALRWQQMSFPVRLLAVIGATAPLEPRTIYATHPDGYAAQMRRTPTQTRFYLGVASGDTIGDWPADTVRAALGRRLGIGDALATVDITDHSLVDLRTAMPSTMQQGNLFLAGDAAHVITPFGGKGMNLAIGDAVELALGIVEYADGDRGRLDAYSGTRLPALWQAQAFSNWMAEMVLAPSWSGDDAGFRQQMGAAWVRSLHEDAALADWFAHAYAGADRR